MRRQEAAREERRTAHAALPKRRLRAAQGPAAARTVCVSGPLVSDRLCQLTVRPNASVEWCQKLWRTSCSRLRHGSTLLPHQAPAGASPTIRCAGCLSRRQSELDLPAQPVGQDDVSKKATRCQRKAGRMCGAPVAATLDGDARRTCWTSRTMANNRSSCEDSHIVGREQEQCLLPHPRLGLHGARHVPQSLILQRKGFRFEHGGRGRSGWTCIPSS